jgi:hypothetical protein
MSKEINKLSDQESIDVLNSLIPPLKSAKINSTTFNQEVTKTDEINKNCIVKINLPDPELENDQNPHQVEGCPFFIHNKKPPIKQFSQNSHSMLVSHEMMTSVSVASEPVVYHDYLQLDKILHAQFPVSAKYGILAHDEHLFIVIHQSKIFI